jgi:predicted nucleic acid-binding protein
VSKRVIVDTGALVALLDAGDAAHAWTVDQFRQISGPLLTCEPVLAEALYLRTHTADHSLKACHE